MPKVKGKIEDPLLKRILKVVSNIYFVIGLLYFGGVGFLGFFMLNKAEDKYTVIAETIGLVVASVMFWALTLSYLKGRKRIN